MHTYRHIQIPVTGGTPTTVVIPMGHRGVINAIRWKQVSGTAAAATLELYCSAYAAAVRAGTAAGPPPAGYLGDPSLYKVCPTMTVSAGELFEAYDKHYEYVNTDGTDRDGRALHAYLSSGGTGAQQWALSINYAISITP